MTINKKIAQVGDRVPRAGVVKVNGTLIEGREESVYLALNKPVGITSTTDPTDPTNIVDFVNYPKRVFNIGRLDKDSEGLILLTDDGDIVNKILRAGNKHDKEYIVTVDRTFDEEFIKHMSSGVSILGQMTRRCKVTRETHNIFRITLTQGLNRQIRRMCEALGYEVIGLKRVRIMNITLDKLPLGQWRELSEEEVSKLLKSLEGSTNASYKTVKKLPPNQNSAAPKDSRAQKGSRSATSPKKRKIEKRGVPNEKFTTLRNNKTKRR